MDHNVNEFKGTFRYLSNMYPCKIKLGNVTYDCAEAAFQAVKLEDKAKRKMFAGLNGYEARKLGRQVKLRADWNKIRVEVMRWIVGEKFRQNPTLRIQLLQLHGRTLKEGNSWGDTFWGVCNGNGQNQLGKLLMEYRDFQYDKYISQLRDMSGYTRLHKNDVPLEIRNVARDIYYEEETGFNHLGHRWWKDEFYAYEEFIENLYGERYHNVYLIADDGTECAMFEL